MDRWVPVYRWALISQTTALSTHQKDHDGWLWMVQMPLSQKRPRIDDPPRTAYNLNVGVLPPTEVYIKISATAAAVSETCDKFWPHAKIKYEFFFKQKITKMSPFFGWINSQTRIFGWGLRCMVLPHYSYSQRSQGVRCQVLWSRPAWGKSKP